MKILNDFVPWSGLKTKYGKSQVVLFGSQKRVRYGVLATFKAHHELNNIYLSLRYYLFTRPRKMIKLNCYPIILVFVPDAEYGLLCVYTVM